MLKIGELAKKTGISVRSLRHYDALGLLKPSAHSESGYRLYTQNDVMRLQQIVSLKDMGIALKLIQCMLNDSAMDLLATLELHQRYLLEQAQHANRLSERLSSTISHLRHQQQVSLLEIFNTMEAIKMREKYYSEEQLTALKQRSFNDTEEAQNAYGEAWQEVFDNLQRFMEDGVKPNDARTKIYAEKADKLVKAFTANDPGIEKSLRKMIDQEGGSQMLKSHGFDVSESLWDYYSQALQAHGYGNSDW